MERLQNDQRYPHDQTEFPDRRRNAYPYPYKEKSQKNSEKRVRWSDQIELIPTDEGDEDDDCILQPTLGTASDVVMSVTFCRDPADYSYPQYHGGNPSIQIICGDRTVRIRCDDRGIGREWL